MSVLAFFVVVVGCVAIVAGLFQRWVRKGTNFYKSNMEDLAKNHPQFRLILS